MGDESWVLSEGYVVSHERPEYTPQRFETDRTEFLVFLKNAQRLLFGHAEYARIFMTVGRTIEHLDQLSNSPSNYEYMYQLNQAIAEQLLPVLNSAGPESQS